MACQENIDIFEDTKNMYQTNEILKKSVKNSTKSQKVFLENSVIDNIDNIYDEDCEVIVSKNRTLEASKKYIGMKVCALNFASSTNPGGGVIFGASAQEESICRCSTLYPCLDTYYNWMKFYKPHRDSKNPLYNDDCIYTENVTVFKTDEKCPEIMEESEWYNVNIITCAAPNLKSKVFNKNTNKYDYIPVRIKDDELFKVQEKRISRILEIASSNNNEVVILGAFGCGAFRNSPYVVANAMKSAISKYRKNFKTIEIAIYCSSENSYNYDTFKNVFENI